MTSLLGIGISLALWLVPLPDEDSHRALQLYEECERVPSFPSSNIIFFCFYEWTQINLENTWRTTGLQVSFRDSVVSI